MKVINFLLGPTVRGSQFKHGTLAGYTPSVPPVKLWRIFSVQPSLPGLSSNTVPYAPVPPSSVAP
jgi:hypothetical protein